MKKKWWIAILTGLCACFMSLAFVACGGGNNGGNDGGSDSVGDNGSLEEEEIATLIMQLSEDESYYIVTGVGNKGCTKIVIPEECKGKPVKEIGAYAFQNCYALTSVKISDSVTTIEDYAFYHCESLASIEIPDSVTTFGEVAFAHCYSLTSVYITDIEAWCKISFNGYGGRLLNAWNLYLNNELVTELVIPDTVMEIKPYAFYSCDSLTSVVIGDSVTSIGSFAFYYCSSLTSIKFNDTSTWYRTTSSFNWNNKIGGTSTSVTSSSQNATYFKSTYGDYYWYKL